MGSIENSETDVKAEKANAMRRYSMKRNISYYLRLTLALLLLSVFLNYYPVLLEAKTSLCFLKSHLFMFLVVNSIVVVVLLSNSPSSSASRIEYVGFSYEPDHVYEEYVAISHARFGENALVADKDEEKNMEIVVVAQSEAAEEVNVVVVARPAEVENYELNSYELNSSFNTNTVVNNNNKYDNNDNNNNNNIIINKYSHRRSRSEMWRSESEVRMTIAGDRGRVRELRRSESTKIGNGGWSCTDPAELGRMNNEEFRLTIENFIATRKKLLRDENVTPSFAHLSLTSSTNVFHSTKNNTELFV